MTRNPEFGITPVWVLPNVWRLGGVTGTKIGTNFFNKMLLNASKFQGYNFYHFWVIKGKPTNWWNYLPTQIRVKLLLTNTTMYQFLTKSQTSGRDISKNCYKYHKEVFNDSYLHKDDYFNEISFLSECTFKWPMQILKTRNQNYWCQQKVKNDIVLLLKRFNCENFKLIPHLDLRYIVANFTWKPGL